jgi:hypothetical protein
MKVLKNKYRVTSTAANTDNVTITQTLYHFRTITDKVR